MLKYSQMLSAQCRTIFRNDLCQLPAQYQILVNKFHKSSCFYSKKDDSHSNDPNATEVTPTIASKYERFTDEKATIILDIEEERDKMLAGEMDIDEIEDTTPNIFEGLNTERKSVIAIGTQSGKVIDRRKPKIYISMFCSFFRWQNWGI